MKNKSFYAVPMTGQWGAPVRGLVSALLNALLEAGHHLVWSSAFGRFGLDNAQRRLKAELQTAKYAFIAVALIALVTGCSHKTEVSSETASVTVSNVTLTAAQRQKIQVYTVASMPFHKTTETTGTVDFDNDQATSVLAPFGGPVSRLLVSPGQKVNAGDPLAEVDSPDFATAISTYRKALSTAQTLRRVADIDKDLIQHNGLAQREEEQAQTDAINAEADRDAALQALVSLNVDPQAIKDLQAGLPVSRPSGTIRSPIAGTVVEKLISPGQLLAAGSTPCFTVADLSRVWVMTQVFGSDLASISTGDSAEVTAGIATNSFAGTVDNIAALVNPDTRAVLVRVVVDNPGDFLKKQMYVRVRIQAKEESTGLLVPAAAILRDDENLPFVYRVQNNGSFARRHVTLGYRTGDQYDIADGLSGGDQIVSDGGLFVQFMQNQ
ncbi:MAG TPA: efflux RND transporter periplasmic adaptor subunit [Verrucomicrobiae bacterium]|nr:efflux RND transporter periplasmic adaptor subunit [Verrucomicrobiae bacterium]